MAGRDRLEWDITFCMAVYRILENIFSFVLSNLEQFLIPAPYIKSGVTSEP
jgi:hypothetical protein